MTCECNRANRRTGLGRSAPQDADREAVLAEVGLHLTIDAGSLSALVLQDGRDIGLADGVTGAGCCADASDGTSAAVSDAT